MHTHNITNANNALGGDKLAERIVTELIVQGAQQFINDFASAGQAVNILTTKLQESERIRTPNLAPQIEAINTALQKASKSGVDYVQTLTQIQQGATQVTGAENQKAQAISAEDKATTAGHHGRITYLSTLSAIHAASFLLSNRTFTLIGSFFTLGAAFSNLGRPAIALGTAFGGLLFFIGQVQQAMQQVQQIVISTAQNIAVGAGVIGAAVFSAGAAGVKIAADAEAGLAGLVAFGGATAQQLAQASEQATQLGIKFGIASTSVIEASSLFARAGGTVQEALDGATEAILKLQVASKGEIDAAQAAIAVSAGIRQFSLTGADAIRVADALAGAAQASALSFTGVTQAFVQAAPGAKTLGISLEDLAATIALLGNQLIKGNITGTSFKQFILDLINPSKQAKSVLDEFGISIQDSSGKIRPLADVLTDLNKALGDEAVKQGRVTEAVRATAIAQIFGSRAGLAANILTREGAQGLQAFRDALAEVTATNITDVLLLPLNKQFERLVVVVQEVGRAFGGPLLAPLKAATSAGIEFFQKFLDSAKLLGQALSATATGTGFGKLQEAINSITDNPKLQQFFTALLSFALNVRNAVVTQLIPAFQDFGTKVTNAIGSIDFEKSLGGFTALVVKLISGTAQVIGFLAELASGFIKAEGAGGRLRDMLGNLIGAVGNTLVGALVGSLIPMAVAISLLNAIGKATLQTAQDTNNFSNVWVLVWEVNKRAVANFLDFIDPRIRATAEELLNFARVAGTVAEAINTPTPENIEKVQTAYQDLIKSSQRLAIQNNIAGNSVKELDNKILSIEATINDLKEAARLEGLALAQANAAREQAGITDFIQPTRDWTGEINALTLSLNELKEARARALGGQAGVELIKAVTNVTDRLKQLRDNPINLSDVINADTTDLTNTLTNIINGLEGIPERIRRAFAGGNEPTTGAIVPDVNAVKQAQDKVVEAGRDFVRRLAALQEDVATKAEDISARATERIGDIFDKANVQLAKLTRDTQEKVDDLNKKFQESRTQSQFLTQFQRQLDDRTTRFQRAVDAQVLIEQRSLEDRRTARQRDTEDVQRNFDLQLQAAERVFSRQQQDAETAFSRVQAARERAFSKQQDSEEKQLQRQLEDEATRRQNAIELAGAAPNDRANVLARQRQAASDTQFQRGQQAQLEALRLRQESARIAFQQQQENAQTAFRRTQEDTLTRFRQAQELLVIDFRRQAENNERTIRRNEEDIELTQRLAREDRLLEFRRNNEDILARVHDFFSLKAHNEELDRIHREASERRGEIIAERNRQVGEVQDQVLLQFRELDKNTNTGLRAIQNSFQDLIENIPDNIKGSPAVAGAIAQVQDIITRGIQTSRTNLTDVKDKVLAVIEATRTLQEAKVGIGAGLGAATQIDMRTIEQPITNGFVAGLQIAHDRGLLPTQTINITVTPGTGMTLQEAINSVQA